MRCLLLAVLCTLAAAAPAVFIAVDIPESGDSLFPLRNRVRYLEFLDGIDEAFEQYNARLAEVDHPAGRELVLQRISVGDTASQVLSDVKDYFASPPPGEEPFGLIGFPVDELAADIVSWSTEESILVVGPYSASALFLATPGRIPPYVIGTRASYSDIFEGMLAFLDSVPSLVFNWRNAVVCMSDGSGGPGNEECRTYYEGLKHRRLHVDAFFADSEDELFSIAAEVGEQRYERIWTVVPDALFPDLALDFLDSCESPCHSVIVGSPYHIFLTVDYFSARLHRRTFTSTFAPPLSHSEEVLGELFEFSTAFEHWRAEAGVCTLAAGDCTPLQSDHFLEGWIAGSVAGAILLDRGFKGTPESFINVAYAVSMPLLHGISLGPLIPEEIASASADPTQNVPFYRSACNNAVRWSWVRSLADDGITRSALNLGVAFRINPTCGGFIPEVTTERTAVATAFSTALVPEFATSTETVAPILDAVPTVWAHVFGLRGSATLTLDNTFSVDVMVGRAESVDELEEVLVEMFDSGRVVAATAFDRDEIMLERAIEVTARLGIPVLSPMVVEDFSNVTHVFPIQLRPIDIIKATFDYIVESICDGDPVDCSGKAFVVGPESTIQGIPILDVIEEVYTAEQADFSLDFEIFPSDDFDEISWDSVDALYVITLDIEEARTIIQTVRDESNDTIIAVPALYITTDTYRDCPVDVAEIAARSEALQEAEFSDEVDKKIISVSTFPGSRTPSGHFDALYMACATAAVNAAPALLNQQGFDSGLIAGLFLERSLSLLPTGFTTATNTARLLQDVIESQPGLVVSSVLQFGPYAGGCRAGPRQALINYLDRNLTMAETDSSRTVVFPGCGYVPPVLTEKSSSALWITFLSVGIALGIGFLIALFIWLAARRRDKRIAEEVIVEEERAAVLQRRLVVSAETERALEDARLLSEQTTKAKSFFLSAISHEMRTPVNSVVVLSKILDNSELTPQQRELAKVIHSSSVALLAGINTVLNVAKLDAGKMPVEVLPTNAVALAEEAMRALPRHTADCVVLPGPGAHKTILVDPTRLMLILEALYSNAMKFAGGESRQPCFVITVDVVPVGEIPSIIDSVSLPENDFPPPFEFSSVASVESSFLSTKQLMDSEYSEYDLDDEQISATPVEKRKPCQLETLAAAFPTPQRAHIEAGTSLGAAAVIGARVGCRFVLIFTVRDNGPGLAREDLASLFSLFVQQDGSHTRRYGGTGLGLALVGRVVSLLEGEVGVASAEGAGSAFSFALPVSATAKCAANENGTHSCWTEKPSTRLRVVDESEFCVVSHALLAHAKRWNMHVALHNPPGWFTASVSDGHVGSLPVRHPGVPPALWTGGDTSAPLTVVVAPPMADKMLSDIELDARLAVMATSALGDEKSAKLLLILPLPRRDCEATAERLRGALDQRWSSVSAIKRPVTGPELYDALVGARVVPEQETGEAPVVLAADDDCINLRILSKLFAELGVPVDTVSDGREAVDAVRKRELEGNPYSLVLLDLQMPRMCGDEAAELIKMEDYSPAVICMSAEPEGIKGFDGVLSKPLRRESLKSLLCRYKIM